MKMGKAGSPAKTQKEWFRCCYTEWRKISVLYKTLGAFLPFTYIYIVKYVRNSGKIIQHSPDYVVIKPFEVWCELLIEGYLHNGLVKHHKASKTFYFKVLRYRSLLAYYWATAHYQPLQFATKFSSIFIGLNQSCDTIVFILGETLSALIVHH